MSEFGFDGYALDGANDAAESLHPLEIARDLIEAGKPRSALEVLSLHYETHADDPGYLLLCAEAWRAIGDTLRAQQALVGAARLAPGDPRPLEVLSELLAERGERDKAERVLAKARALERKTLDTEGPLGELSPEQGQDDLIAAAERRERSKQGALSPRHISIAVVVLGGFGLLSSGIALLAEPKVDAGSLPAEAATVAKAQEPDPVPKADPIVVAPAAEPSESVPENIALIDTMAPPPAEDEPLVETAPLPRRTKAARPRRSAATPARSRGARSSDVPTEAMSTDGMPAEPDPATVRADLESMSPERLTTRADALYAQGHTALAASYYRRALDIDADYAPALVGVGRGILRAEKYEEAMSNATRALQLARGVDARPGLEAEAIYQMGRVHLERGERDAARQLLRQSVSLTGVPAEAWFYLGEALASDNSPAARRAYEKYLRLVSDGALADRARRAIR